MIVMVVKTTNLRLKSLTLPACKERSLTILVLASPEHQRPEFWVAPLMIPRNESAFKLAPPTNAPSTSG